jgi:hypothetical protein
MDRVALIGLLWFALWIGAGDAIGLVFQIPGTGMVVGFIFGLITILLWPWMLPRAVDDWMHDPRA